MEGERRKSKKVSQKLTLYHTRRTQRSKHSQGHTQKPESLHLILDLNSNVHKKVPPKNKKKQRSKKFQTKKEEERLKKKATKQTQALKNYIYTYTHPLPLDIPITTDPSRKTSSTPTI